MAGENTVTLYVKVDGTASDPEDVQSPGLYRVDVDRDLAAGDQVSAALDAFHEHWAIGVLDDFTFRVLAADGVELKEAESAEPYALGHRAKFHGPVDLVLPDMDFGRSGS